MAKKKKASKKAAYKGRGAKGIAAKARGRGRVSGKKARKRPK